MKNCCIILLFLLAWTGFGQIKTHTFQEVEALNKTTPKPTLVFIHTSWCKYCKMMENSTFKNPEVMQLLNDSFYFVSLNAEEKSDITFLKHTFRFKPSGKNTGVHELATELATMNNEIVYPTMVVLAGDYSILFQKHSFTNAKELITILQKLK
ncbi:thioredoxin family protein [Flavobacterium sp. GCM10027622]|uniref:thioredoxin family protein n=1 Tax=unclassified Flavobacterium TaxID=196869 RepID=UPI003622964F